MIQDINKYVDFLCRHQITADQFLLCFLLYSDAYAHSNSQKYTDKGRILANMYKYYENVKPWKSSDVEDLVDKGLLKNRNKAGDTSPDLMEVTDLFVAEIMANEDDFDVFWEQYPGYIANFTNPRGAMIPLKSGDREELFREFKKLVTTKSEFRKLMDALKWAKENGMVTQNIRNWLTSKQWVELEKLQEQGHGQQGDIVI